MKTTTTSSPEGTDARLRNHILLVWLLLTVNATLAQDVRTVRNAFDGKWTVNEELSDDTDRQVEIAIREAGGKPPNTGKKGKGRYRGGPEEHALYDHITYDNQLVFHYQQPEFQLEYDDGYTRIFHDDGRKRIISASGTVSGDNQDFSFASWNDNKLYVESSVRDGGYILETFEILQETSQLRISMELNPSSFAKPIMITRIYDRPSE